MPVVVLPDIPLPRTLLDDVASQVGPVLFRHPTGAAWIAGTADGRRVLRAANAHLEVVLIGSSLPPAADRLLERLLGNKRSVAELDEAAGALAEGDVILFARGAGRMRCQPPLFLMRSLCWTNMGDAWLVCDDQLTLKTIAGLRPDPAVLASRLTDAELCHPFGLASIWRGLRTVAPGEWLDSRSGGPPLPVVWWRPPEPARTVSELSDQMRASVFAALERRTAHHPAISADLSGGLDSTTLNFYLAAMGRKASTVFLASANVANNDHRWADRAAGELGTAHQRVPYGTFVQFLLDAEIEHVSRFPEGPCVASTAIASVPFMEDLLAGTGTTLHLNGHAGDALFGPVSTVLWSLVRSREKRRYRSAWRHRVVNRHPLGTTLRMLTRNESYRQDLERIARSDFTVGDHVGVSNDSRWVPLPTVHPALTDAARELLRDLARQAVASGCVSLSGDRTNHQILQFLTVHGSMVRQMNQAGSPRAGIYFDSPYLDRAIVETSLSLKIGDRARQYPAKPLLAAARPPDMSLDYFTRRDKGNYTAEIYQHHRSQKPALRRLFAEGSALADLGLIAPERMLHSIEQFSVKGQDYNDIAHLAFAERWLRSASATPSHQGG